MTVLQTGSRSYNKYKCDFLISKLWHRTIFKDLTDIPVFVLKPSFVTCGNFHLVYSFMSQVIKKCHLIISFGFKCCFTGKLADLYAVMHSVYCRNAY